MTPHDLSFEDWRQRRAALRPEGRAFIDGAYGPALSGQTFARVSPIDGSHLADVARCGAADVDRAVAAARAAFDKGDWRHAEPRERKRVMLRFAELIRENLETLALLESADVGKPIRDALNVDVPFCADAIAYYAECADKLYEEIAPTGPNDRALVRRMPLGVVAAIVPWNYPLIIAAWKIGPALLMGNSVILKPAEQSSLGSLLLGRLAKEAGVPDGVFNVVPGLGEEAGAALSSHPDVDLIAFTGSTEVGARIMAAAATSNLKRVALELGGKSPQIVMADCPDLDAAASAVAWGVYYNAGETCHAGTRLLVQRSIADDFHARVVAETRKIKSGHPLDPTTQFGALIEASHRDRVMRYIGIGREEGAKLAMGGGAPETVSGGAYVEPTLLVDVAPDARVAREEIFGPVLVSIPFDTEAEALAIANGTEYGLAAAVWTADINRAHRMSEALRAGTVWINTYDQSSMATPFGGFKRSGFGRDRSLHAIDKYADLKTVWTHFS
jgi:acyl-CoA reductase-like NAD-dependent aldehyde dehydrogenase